MTSIGVLSMDDSLAAAKHKHHAQPSTKELLLKVKERDDMIKDLLLRVEALENKRNGVVVAQPASSVDANPSSPPASLPPAEEVATQAPQTNSAPQTQSAKPDAPGQFSVDVQASQRALERTLAKSGALLLPSGYLDTDINFAFSHSETPSLITVSSGQADAGETVGRGQQSVFSGRARQNIFDPSVAFRLGLPFDSQLELNLPYRFVDHSTVAAGQNLNIKANNSALGDIQVGLAKTLLKEEKWWPDVVARVRWNTGSGEAALGGGVNSITGSLSLLKRQDPLAFFLNGSYTKSFTQKNYFAGANGLMTSYNPGDTLGFSFGAQLAASSDTSLSFSLDQLFVSNVQQGFDTIAGSNRNVGILSIGASSIISRNFFVNLSVGVGLTNDAPDYTAGITLSNRTNLRPYLGLK